jgi:twitching motility two-component system response regulator PilG
MDLTQKTAAQLLAEGIAAARSGRKSAAHDLIQEATALDPSNEMGWLWLAGVANTPQEAISYLRKALEVNPSCERARQGLALFERPPTHKPAPAMTGRPSASAQPGLDPKSKPTVLVVDDSPTVRKLVTMTLEKQGYRVALAADGIEALAKIHDDPPGLILLDISMPRMDGYQLCKTVKENVETAHIPVVMLSGKDDPFARAHARLMGAAGHIPKPFSPQQLISKMRECAAA